MGLFRSLAVPVLLSFALVLPGCDDEDKIVVENQPPTNNPPLIVQYGPESPVESIAHFGVDGVDLWVLAGDPDGLDDISVATLHIDSIQLNRFIARPDMSNGGCLQFGYVDTVDTAPLLAVPAMFPGIDFLAMKRDQGGLFTADGLGSNYGYINRGGVSGPRAAGGLLRRRFQFRSGTHEGDSAGRPPADNHHRDLHGRRV